MKVEKIVNTFIESNFLHGVNVFIGSRDKDIFSESYGYSDDLHNHEMTLDKVFDYNQVYFHHKYVLQ